MIFFISSQKWLISDTQRDEKTNKIHFLSYLRLNKDLDVILNSKRLLHSILFFFFLPNLEFYDFASFVVELSTVLFFFFGLASPFFFLCLCFLCSKLCSPFFSATLSLSSSSSFFLRFLLLLLSLGFSWLEKKKSEEKRTLH